MCEKKVQHSKKRRTAKTSISVVLEGGAMRFVCLLIYRLSNPQGGMIDLWFKTPDDIKIIQWLMSIIVHYGHFAGNQGEDLKIPTNPEIKHLSWVLS